MEITTKHQPTEWGGASYGLSIHEEIDGQPGSSNADIDVWISDFIDSRTELNIEIKKRSLEFLKRAVATLEDELKG